MSIIWGKIGKMKTRIVPEQEDAVFHLVSRTAFRSLNIGTEEKRVFRDLLHKQATFSGVQVLSYCFLDNHFHLLVRIPHSPNISDQELVRRYRHLYGEMGTDNAMEPTMLEAILKNGGDTASNIRKQLLSRMGSVSIFMKELKQRFCIWYNRKHDNEGTLWAKRFESILVEDVAKVLEMVGAYIDLNPVRLKICQSPTQYAFCTSGDATQGNHHARKALCNLMNLKKWSSATAQKYQNRLHQEKGKLKGDVFSLSGMKKGVVGRKAFVQKWNDSHQKTLQGKSHFAVSLLKGLCFAGLCAVNVKTTFAKSPYSL